MRLAPSVAEVPCLPALRCVNQCLSRCMSSSDNPESLLVVRSQSHRRRQGQRVRLDSSPFWPCRLDHEKRVGIKGSVQIKKPPQIWSGSKAVAIPTPGYLHQTLMRWVNSTHRPTRCGALNSHLRLWCTCVTIVFWLAAVLHIAASRVTLEFPHHLARSSSGFFCVCHQMWCA